MTTFSRLENKQWVAYEPSKEEMTEYATSTKLSCLRAVDEAAGKARLRYVTSIPGQAETYLVKLNDAQRYAAAGYPEDLSLYPWVQAEAAGTGEPAQAVADSILATYSAWVLIGTAIEGRRIGAKYAIQRSSTPDEMLEVAAAAVAFLDAV